jgi:uncharacterized protein YcbK (DUF882 family)
MKLTEHFSLSEFTCRCGCGETSIDLRLAQALEEIRARIGLPITIDSGFRCAKRNKAVGGAADSRNLIGQAADCSGDFSLDAFRAAALESKYINGIGVDRQRGFIHIDVRKGPLVEWAYKDGKSVSLGKE